MKNLGHVLTGTAPLVACIAAGLALSTAAVAQEHGHGAGQLPATAQARFPEEVGVVEVPFRFEGQKILVDVSVAGSEPLEFVLDTGAPVAVLLGSARLGETELDYAGTVFVGGVGGSGKPQPSRLARGVRLGIGALHLEEVSLVVLPEEGMKHLGPRPWGGIFGGQLFANAVVEIDWRKRVLRLHDPSGYEAPEGAVALPLVKRGGHVYVSCEVTVDGEKQEVELVVDTGASHALALRSDRVGAPARKLTGATLGRGLNGVVQGEIGRVDELRLAGFALAEVVTSFAGPSARNIAVGGDGNLGVEVLRRFVVTFDYPRGRMLLVPTDALSEPFVFPTSGMRIEPWIAEDGTVGVDDVYPDSPAARAELAPGDRILAVDSKPVAELGVEAVRERLSQAPGTRVRITVRKEDAERVVELVLATVL